VWGRVLRPQLFGDATIRRLAEMQAFSLETHPSDALAVSHSLFEFTYWQHLASTMIVVPEGERPTFKTCRSQIANSFA